MNYRSETPEAEVLRLREELEATKQDRDTIHRDRDKFKRRVQILATVVLGARICTRRWFCGSTSPAGSCSWTCWGSLSGGGSSSRHHVAAVRLAVDRAGVEGSTTMATPDRNDTPVQGVPGIPQHMITWDSYQDGRIRVSLVLGGLALTVAILALLVAFRRPAADTTQHPVVCPEVSVPACPSCPPIPACPVIPPYPACPSQRPSHGNHSHRDS